VGCVVCYPTGVRWFTTWDTVSVIPLLPISLGWQSEKQKSIKITRLYAVSFILIAEIKLKRRILQLKTSFFLKNKC